MDEVAKYKSPPGRVLTHGARLLLEEVYRYGSEEQRSQLRSFDDYTFPLDLEAMTEEEERYNAALDELRTIVMELR